MSHDPRVSLDAFGIRVLRCEECFDEVRLPEDAFQEILSDLARERIARGDLHSAIDVTIAEIRVRYSLWKIERGEEDST